MRNEDLLVFQEESARRQYIRRAAVADGLVDADRLTTLARLRGACLRAARRAGLLTLAEPSEVQRLLLIRRVAHEAARQQPGRTPAALADILESLIGLLSPLGDEAGTVTDWLLGHPEVSKLHDLGRLYTLYRERLHADSYSDARDACSAILRLLRGDRTAWPAKLADLKGRLLLRAVRWLEPFEERWVEILAERLGRDKVRIASALPPAHAEKMEDRLAARIRSEVLAGAEEGAWTGWAEDLGDAMAVDDAGLAVDSRERLTFLRSAGRAGEIEDLARRIRFEMDNEGVRPERIALVLRRPEDYLPLIERTFGAFGIPWFSRVGASLSDAPVARLAMALLRFPLQAERDRFCALLQSPALEWPDMDSWEERATLAHELRAAGLGVRLNAADIRNLLAGRGIAPERIARLAELFDRLTALHQPAAPAEQARRALKLLADFGFAAASAAAPRSERQTLALITDLLRQAERSSGRAPPMEWAEFLDVVARAGARLTLPAAGGDESGVWILSPAHMAGLHFDVVLIGGLNEGVFPAIPRQDALLSDVERDAARRALSRGGHDWPQWSLPLSSVRGVQESILFLISVGAARERLVLACPAQDDQGRALNPGEYFRVLWMLAGDPAADAPPGDSWHSTVPLAACQGRGEAQRRIARLLEESDRASAERELTAFMADAERAAPGAAGQRLERLLRIEWEREAFFNRGAESGGGAAPYCGRPDSEPARRIVRQWLDRHPQISPTALEALALCRFRFLMGQVFRLKPVRIQDDAPDRMDRGLLLHRALDEVYRGLRGEAGWPESFDAEQRAAFAGLLRPGAWAVEDAPGAWRLEHRAPPRNRRSIPLARLAGAPPDELLSYTRAVCAAVFDQAERGAGRVRLGDPAVWASEKPKLARIVENIVRLDAEHAETESRFPALFELDFGGRAADQPAVQLGEPGRGTLARGRVDRVDLVFDADGRLSGLLVLDYKSPSRAMTTERERIEEIATHLNCQLPVYGFAAQDVLFGRHDDAEFNAMTEVLFHIQERDPDKLADHFARRRVRLDYRDETGSPLTGLFLGALMNNLDRLRRADFSVAPMDCRYCDFAGICRVDVSALEHADAGAE